jgi:predicted nucleotidyltransferase
VDLSSPIRSLIPSLDSAVLEVLARVEGELSLSEIARLARRGSRTGISPVIDRLVEHGLVVAGPSNRGHLYRLNREHVLAQAVWLAMQARGEVLARIGAALETWRPSPLHASSFGSFARRDGDADSDIDVVIVFRSDSEVDAAQDHLDRLRNDVQAWTGNQLDYLVLVRSDLASLERESVFRDIERDGVRILGPDWRTLRDTGAANS